MGSAPLQGLGADLLVPSTRRGFTDPGDNENHSTGVRYYLGKKMEDP